MKTIIYLIIAGALCNTVSSVYAEEKKDDAAELIVKGNTEFAFDLYAQLKAQEGNLFFSPYSISTALAMTYAGAKGQTAEQMVQTLHFAAYIDHKAPDTQESFHPAFGQLIEQLNRQGQKGDYQLSVVNALWGQKDYTFLDSFIQLNKNCYRAGLENVDFTGETEKTRSKINQWVENKTQEKIKNLIPKGVLDAMTRLVLTNAIYFKGDWADQFDKKQTKDEPFYISYDKSVQAPLMHRKGEYKYGEWLNVKYAHIPKTQILELPYKGKDLSMIILLPEERDISRLEEALTPEMLNKCISKLRQEEVDVFLPKFKITSQFGLADTLKKMGMSDAFDESKADFSAMTGGKELFISAVLHKAFVEVNEEGTEAAAATGVVVSLKSAPAPPLVFRADHPFVFVIQDNKTKSILFVGRVVDPSKTGE